MRKTLLGLLGAGIIVVSGAALVGCGAADTSQTSTRPAAAELKDGLTVISASATKVDAAYKQNGRVVYFQSRVGALKPDVYRENFPDEPDHEMDQRFVDHEGRTFKLQIGGDELIDTTWAQDIAQARALGYAAPALREQDFLIARAAAGAFRAASAPELAHHQYHLSNLAQHIPSEIPKLQQRTLELTTTKLPTLEATAENGYTASDSANWWEGDLYGKCIYLCVGHHSSVWGWNAHWSGTALSWDENIVSCNHGACANDSSMGYKSYTNSGWVYGYKDIIGNWSKETSTSNVGYTAGSKTGCQTNYNWNTPPGHLCNDDSSFEMWNIYDAASKGGASNSKGTNTSFCNGGAGGTWNACSCSSACNNCSGDWGYPGTPGTH